MKDQPNTLRKLPIGNELDRIDRSILSALQKEARLSNKELAALVGLAESSCLERVRRLRRLDVLRGTHAEVAPAALGIELQALAAVQLRQHSREHVESFHRHALAVRGVVAVYHVAGEHDFLVHVAVPSATALRDLVLDAFTARPEVVRLQTWLIFDATRAAGLPDYGAGEPSRMSRTSPRRARRSAGRGSARS